MMQDQIGIPPCFSSSSVVQKLPTPAEDYKALHHVPTTNNAAAVTRSGQSLFMSVYKTKMGNQCRLITITWCKNLLLHGLSVSVQAANPSSFATTGTSHYTCKVELKPWYFWRKQGTKRFNVDGIKPVDVYWDLKSAKFNGETEPASEYYVAVVCDQELVLLLGDLKKDAYRRTGCRPSLVEPVLLSKKEHVFGKKKFTTRAKFHEKGRHHEISIQYKISRCGNGSGSSSSKNSNGGGGTGTGSNNYLVGGGGGGMEPEMEVRIDGIVAIQVKHLQWKFRGNQSIHLNRLRIDVFWDVHDWLFCPGLRHGLFIFKPVINNVHPLGASSSPSSTLSSSSFSSPALSASSFSSPLSSKNTATAVGGDHQGLKPDAAASSSEFCLFLYAWKVE